LQIKSYNKHRCKPRHGSHTYKLNTEQEGKTGPVSVLVPVGGDRIEGKAVGGEYGGNTM
jgi:hypothetical protein